MVKIITTCTDEKYYLPYLRQSVIENGGEMVILGMGEKWGGYIWKFNKMIDYLKNLDKDEVVCFVDGYDVVCVKNLGDIEEKFRETGHKLIIGRDHSNVPEIVMRLYFGKLRINSGTYIGRAGDILDILTGARTMFPEVIDDQILIIKYAETFPGQIWIDENMDFFYVYGKPFSEADIKGNPYFVHASACSRLNNILGLDQRERDRVNSDMRRLFITKAAYHTGQMLIRLLLIALVFYALFIIIKMIRLK